jgi:UDP-N-acetylglucosamine--N-acetylmuramyl-(pentapeptide) pyrophosphoryl-undecaprenol N-acetylglucosamine transferase
VFAGPSGGHLFPALAFAEAVRGEDRDARLYLVTSRKAEGWTGGWNRGVFARTFYLENFPLPAGISLRTLGFLLKLPRAFWQTYGLLRLIKPCLCAGFGSYVAYPGIVLARRMGIPTLIHEQNLAPGRATRALLGRADCVAVSFPDTFARETLARRVVTGLPLRAALRNGAGQPRGRGSRFTLLVQGGSQGAHKINKAVIAALRALNPEEKRETAVIHITGPTDFRWISEAYGEIGLEHEIHPFFESMQVLYRRADMAVTRAGANTLFELALYRLPAVVIPYPHAGAHQSSNAEYFQSRRAVVYQEEKMADGDWLLKQIRSLKNDLEYRRSLSAAVGSLAEPGAADKLARLALGLADRGGRYGIR